jgi:uncharacterized membrane protein (UPF0127 family)
MSCYRDVDRRGVRALALGARGGGARAFAPLGGLGARAASIQPLEIVTKNGVQVFSVEMATTEEEKTTGLMYRKELADGKGMLFDFSPEQEVSMWMKNTFISLDMIFIRADGRILRIAENTEPQSTRIISSGGPAKGVLEVIAGTARRNTASRPETVSGIRSLMAADALRRALLAAL